MPIRLSITWAHSSYSRHRVHFFQNLTAVYGTLNGRIPTLPKALDLGAFDVLVIHYTNYLPSYECFDALARERIAQFGGLKVLFLQDEYREINLITEHIGRLGIDVLFTCVPEPEIETVYPAAKLPGVTKVATLTGFVPEELVERECRACIGDRSTWATGRVKCRTGSANSGKKSGKSFRDSPRQPTDAD